MGNKPLIETFFFIGLDKLSLYVFEDNHKKIFEKEIFKKDYNENLNGLIDFFLSENIIKIEKKIDKFINDINLIIFDYKFLPIKASIKKKNTAYKINKNDLEHLLFDLKQQIKENNLDKSIIHMRINNFIIDGKKFLSLDDDLNCNNICLEVDFVCLPIEVIENFSKQIKKYQISIDKIFSIDYLNERFKKLGLSECQMALKLKYENDENEVHLIKKNKEKLGVFERFFRFFS